MKSLLIFQPTIGSYRVDLYNSLARKFRVNIFIEYNSSSFEIFDANEVNDSLSIPPRLLKKLFKFVGRQIYSGYWKAISDTNPDIVIVSEFGIDAIAAIIYRFIYRKKYKIVSLCDDSYHMLSNNWDFSKFHKYMRKILVPNIDDIILVEPDSRAWYKKHYGKGYYFPIISNEDNIRKKYCNALSLSNKYVQDYKLDSKIVFIYVGRLIEIKNVNTIIEAFNKLSLPNAKLIIIGDGDKAKELRQLALCNTEILFTGRLTGDNLYAWYNIADALILPSMIEPFGAVTNEALIGGCKVLVSSHAGSKCLVRHGVNGFHINPNDIRDICDKMCLIHSQSLRRGEKIKNIRDSLMLDEYDKMTTELIKFLENL